MPDTTYDSLADLRAALSSDNAEKRSDAYGHVFGADVEPRDVQVANPDEEAVATLVDDGVIPATGADLSGGKPSSEYYEEMVALLEEIAANTGGGS